tara:strand:+ start:94 stop:462 length:369 start_codon:yes stop_codon:yes gene_type:complete
MTELTRSEKMIAEKTVCILLVRGENADGGPIFAYVGVRADRLEEFMAAQEDGTFYPEEYGVIIESGEGEPSEEVKAKMRDEYGFNHDAMVDIDSAERANSLKSEIVKTDPRHPDHKSEDTTH